MSKQPDTRVWRTAEECAAEIATWRSHGFRGRTLTRAVSWRRWVWRKMREHREIAKYVAHQDRWFHAKGMLVRARTKLYHRKLLELYLVADAAMPRKSRGVTWRELPRLP